MVVNSRGKVFSLLGGEDGVRVFALRKKLLIKNHLLLITN